VEQFRRDENQHQLLLQAGNRIAAEIEDSDQAETVAAVDQDSL
jgi:hypothetical protein